ncbi:hypothetical protein [Plebeiibacterium sediminum]|uniref:Uncharacterized protein n=1 Tax=Plebeiibacterium sediminum TaxID=2992112 RepID=A0AAE3M916_9BACT|nr:hypothetical protein [Plebeiobacterium sediminum]MCW3789202.1 hypothetical protein [Plebeiobacterium sediminum]
MQSQKLYIYIFLFLLLASAFPIPYISMLSIGIFLFALYLFINKLGKTIPLKELAFLVASIQLLLSSFLAFYIQDPDKAFLPKIPPEDYFYYAVPGIILYALGLFTFDFDISTTIINTRLSLYDKQKIAKQFIGIGYLGVVITPFAPGGLSYFFTLLIFLSYIGGIIVLLDQNSLEQKTFWVILAFLPVLRDAFFSGVFFLALIWVTFAFLYYMLKYNHLSFTKKFITILFAIYMTMTLDGAKKDYREIVWEDSGRNISFIERSSLLGKLILERLTFQNFNDENNVSARITRANQGALVTWVMNWVPEKESYANGSTIKDAVIAAIFPRFLMPNKVKAGGKESFERFTGQKLRGSTSMNISLLGEGWANYGYWGGLLFMYAVGLFYSFALKKFTSLIGKYPIYFYFIPYLFIYIIKAEDDLLTPLNHIIKASITLYFLHYLLIKKNVTVYE